MREIYFAGGCFWGTEHYLKQFEGVVETTVGYANGNIPNPTYEEVYTDSTGYVECVKVVYDPEVISLATLCRLFFKSIDPLLKDRQGNDIGTRYRTGIYWAEGDDADVVGDVYSEVQGQYTEPLVVEKCPLKCFYSGEEYHQDYLDKTPGGYCHLSFVTLQSARLYGDITRSLRLHSDEEKKRVLPRFFKTGKGEYGEGDKFIGVAVPNIRKVARRFSNVPLEVVENLLESEWHECRMCALLILIEKYRGCKGEIVEFYLKHTRGINNWDLVDLSAPYILGAYLMENGDHSILYRLSQSSNMWEQRIAVVSTLTLIRKGHYEDTIRLAEAYLNTPYDLMRKAVGWMLREVGKRDESLLTSFLDKYAGQMPRTMLRYSIEKLTPDQRGKYLHP